MFSFNFVELTEIQREKLDSFLVYVKLKGYFVEYMCLFEHNMQTKSDGLFIYKDDLNLLLLFYLDKKIKIQQEKKILKNVFFDFCDIDRMLQELYCVI
jgi:hypothetical protein